MAIHLAASLRMGDWLRNEVEKDLGGRPEITPCTAQGVKTKKTYADLGLEYTDAFRLQRLYDWEKETQKASEEKERKRDKAFGLWLACHTQEEIAASVDMTRQAVATWEDEFAKKLESDNFANSPDFDPPLYNIWKQQSKSNKVDHFGNSGGGGYSASNNNGLGEGICRKINS